MSSRRQLSIKGSFLLLPANECRHSLLPRAKLARQITREEELDLNQKGSIKLMTDMVFNSFHYICTALDDMDDWRATFQSTVTFIIGKNHSEVNNRSQGFPSY